MFCAYGNVYQNASEQLRGKQTYMKEWQSQILTLHRQGVSEQGILEQVFGGESRMGILTEGCISRAQFIHQMIYQQPLFVPEAE